MNGLADLRMFSEIARSGNMSVAAGRLGMSPATISGRLKAMEEHYGVALVRRTTRSLSLTDDGRILLERARSVIDDFEDLERTMTGRKREPAGRLVVASPPDVLRRQVGSLVQAFSYAHPEIDFEFQFDGGAPSAESSIDVAFMLGPLKDSDLVARRLAELAFVTCASPAYLDRHGSPATPDALIGHHCLVRISAEGRDDRWLYQCRGGLRAYPVQGRHASNDHDMLLDLALQGQGFLRAYRPDVEEALRSGALVPVLGEFEPPAAAFHLVSGNRRLLPSRAVRFIDFVVGHMRQAIAGGEAVGDGNLSFSQNRENDRNTNNVKFFSLQNYEKKFSSLANTEASPFQMADRLVRRMECGPVGSSARNGRTG
jgi:DNA-binding transcriptional LysR family regulator